MKRRTAWLFALVLVLSLTACNKRNSGHTTPGNLVTPTPYSPHISSENTDVSSGKLDREGYKEVAAEISRKYGCGKVAITLRESISANDNRWSGMLFDGNGYYFSKTYDIHLWDRVGGGDSFGAGLIYSLVNGKDSQYAIDFAAAASCLKQTIQGDFNRITVKEAENLMKGSGSGRVER